ncbi:aldose epimerase family protein [Roseobacteraceae bacterium S113]
MSRDPTQKATQISFGPLTLDLHGIGARMSGLTFHERDMMIRTPDDFDPDSEWGYVGAIVGPVGNRLTPFAGLTGWQGLATPPEDGVILHGNPNGVHAMQWDLVQLKPRSAVFALELPSGHGGFAAARTLRATYSLPRQNAVRLELTAQSDAPTLMNLASHPYWALGPGLGTQEHRLQVLASHILPTDALTLPTGEIMPVRGTEFDFNIPRALIPGEPDLDHNFCIASARRDEMEIAAFLEAPDGWAMELWTTEPGLQVYDGRTTDAYDMPAYAGVAIEPQFWPNAPSHANFPSIALRPGEIYRATSEMRFKVGSGRMRETGTSYGL